MLPIPNFLGNIIILSSILLARYVNSSDAVNVSSLYRVTGLDTLRTVSLELDRQK